MLYQIPLSTRPRQWVKNLFFMAALIFSRHLFDWDLALLGMGCFWLLSGGVYLVNDLSDLEQDRLHPRKSSRPLAAGKLAPDWGAAAAVVLLGGGLAGAFYLGRSFGLVAAAYALLNLAYSYRLKELVLVDVIVVAAGFLLRAIGGALVIEVVVSTWFILCSFTLALFLAAVKRRQESRQARRRRRSPAGPGGVRRGIPRPGDLSADLGHAGLLFPVRHGVG